VIPSLDPSVNT
jgi:hydrocephalus-inducing protein